MYDAYYMVHIIWTIYHGSKWAILTFFRLIFWLFRSWFLSWNWFCCVFLWFCIFSWCVFVCFFRWVFWLWCGFAWAWLFGFLCFYSTCLFRKYRLFIWYLKQSVYQTINKYKHIKRANKRANSLWWPTSLLICPFNPERVRTIRIIRQMIRVVIKCLVKNHVVFRGQMPSVKLYFFYVGWLIRDNFSMKNRVWDSKLVQSRPEMALVLSVYGEICIFILRCYRN